MCLSILDPKNAKVVVIFRYVASKIGASRWWSQICVYVHPYLRK